MWLRIERSVYRAMDREARKAAFRAVVEAGPPPGLLAYEAGRAIGWCAVGPRRSFARFDAAKASRVDDADADRARIFAITCFYTRAGHRRRGLMRQLATAAIAFAREGGAAAVDVCAIDPDRALPWGEGFVGITPVFAALGFREIARRSPRRPLMRLELTGQ
jgi:GNAT superfamily N-acetyltransferase